MPTETNDEKKPVRIEMDDNADFEEEEILDTDKAAE
jgi:hypothetical protein